jgi:hypothetical protein
MNVILYNNILLSQAFVLAIFSCLCINFLFVRL